MAKANYQRSVYAFTPSINRRHTLSQLLEHPTLHIQTADLEQLFQHTSNDKHKILLFDYRDRESLLPYLSPSHPFSLNIETIVINVPYKVHTEKLLELGNLKGLFYLETTHNDVVDGITKIQNGKNWLPRHVTSQLIHYYRHVFRNYSIKATIELTAREIQILRALQSGANNSQMADDLFISEYTVKSHLYQIFKKISVKNRSQAITWARNNLFS